MTGDAEVQLRDNKGNALNSGQKRVLICDVQPSVDDGRHPVKRVLNDVLTVTCDLVSDGHEKADGVLRYRLETEQEWREEPLEVLGNDRYGARCALSQLGQWEYCIHGWIDEYGSWLHAVQRKHAAGQDVSVELLGGHALLEGALTRAGTTPDAGASGAKLLELLSLFSGGAPERCVAAAGDADIIAFMRRHADRRFSTESSVYRVSVEPVLARFSAWYELFPRSFGEDGRHGTFADVERLIPYVASMGFDVLYFPPIHPIGRTFRKGPNNTLEAGPDDPGSTWAIGSEAGGHKAIHPELGTVDDFCRLVNNARDAGLEIALDIAFQASPDHPYVKEHPEWFVHRADGSIQYAENPPKKYQDVYPFDLAGPAWRSLWEELRSVFEVWIERGVRIFRVDNPHTKPIPFWEYCINDIKRSHPDVIFLSEAFTRPKLMYALAKVGFSQSYTYFTWRTTSHDLQTYLTELTSTPVREFFRPNFWPNTPDILPEHLQFGGRPMYLTRLVLAGTLSSNFGIYGPAFELMEHVARPGAEEYIDNEKFQLRRWDLNRPDSLRPVIARLNKIRRENPALHSNDTLVFHGSDNDRVLAYSKVDRATGNVILVVVNVEPQHRHSAWLELDLAALLIEPGETFQVHDLISEARFLWSGSRAYVELAPDGMPAHVFKLRRRLRTEQSFEYFM